MKILGLSCLAPFALLGATPAAIAADLAVLATQPARHELAVPRDTDVVVDFDRAVDPASLPPAAATFLVFGKQTGPAAGTFALENGGLRVRFTPAEPFAAGEDVVVVVTEDLQAVDGSFVRTAGYAWQFRTLTKPSSRTFHELDEFSNHTSSATTRIYGSQTADYDNDGWIDLATINEDSSDVRVFLSLGDGTGLFGPMLLPPSPTGSIPSPNEAADFDLDGEIDIVTCNTSSGNVSVLLGDGDGTFQPQSLYTVGFGPHGIAVLEANGDGYPDIATSNTGSTNVALILNDGTGHFGAPTFFNGGGRSEYALGAGDMNNDGIFDLVVGNRGSQTVVVHLSNGNGVFTQAGSRPAGGWVWMIQLGDVNGDGNLDVSCANGESANGSILLGDGAGGLSVAQLDATGSNAVATDLGDLDGDGDLDWIVACFGGAEWDMFVNDGAGNFAFDQDFDAAAAASCAGMVDFDMDGDLDLALTDELADLVTLMKNDYSGVPYCFGDGSSLACPCSNESALGAGEGCRNSTGLGGVIDATGAGSVGADDLVARVVQLPLNQNGLVYSGLNTSQLPFGDGHRCIGGGIVRFPVKNSGSSGSFSQQSIASMLGLAPGETRRLQGWYRDPMGPCGTAFNLTNALTVVFAP